MAYQAIELINRAWYLSGIVSRGMETVSGEQESDGLFLLNSLLDFKSTDLRLIPYFKRFTFNLVVGQEEYFIQGLYDIETMTFNIGTVRYPMTYVNRDLYFGNGRVDNIVALPFQYTYERELDGSRIFVYYLPQENYVAKLTAKFGLQNVSYNTDLLSVYDPFYVEYLRYSLAEVYCDEYDVKFSDQKKAMLMSYEKKLIDVSPPDLTMKKVNFITGKTAINWAYVNLSNGYSPS